MNADVERIWAALAERERLIQRETEIRNLPVEEVTPELDAEALECWLAYERSGWSDSAVRTLLRIIDQQQAVIQAAGEVDGAIYERRIDRWGMEHIYLRMGGHEHGFDREDTNPLAMALFKLHDALAALDKLR